MRQRQWPGKAPLKLPQFSQGRESALLKGLRHHLKRHCSAHSPFRLSFLLERELIKFAGDTNLAGITNTPEVKFRIQKDLDRLEQWALCNKMNFNVEKSEAEGGWTTKKTSRVLKISTTLQGVPESNPAAQKSEEKRLTFKGADGETGRPVSRGYRSEPRRELSPLSFARVGKQRAEPGVARVQGHSGGVHKAIARKLRKRGPLEPRTSLPHPEPTFASHFPRSIFRSNNSKACVNGTPCASPAQTFRSRPSLRGRRNIPPLFALYGEGCSRARASEDPPPPLLPTPSPLRHRELKRISRPQAGEPQWLSRRLDCRQLSISLVRSLSRAGSILGFDLLGGGGRRRGSALPPVRFGFFCSRWVCVDFLLIPLSPAPRLLFRKGGEERSLGARKGSGVSKSYREARQLRARRAIRGDWQQQQQQQQRLAKGSRVAFIREEGI
ncbi:hypothetical protein L345_05415, partial [Ophiophagus hannah]